MFRSKRTTAPFVPNEPAINEIDNVLVDDDAYSDDEMEDVQPGSNPSQKMAWIDKISNDEDDVVETIDADGKIDKKKGKIKSTQVWFAEPGMKFIVGFNQYKQPVGKGGHVLVKFLGEVATKGTLCPIGEITWRKVHYTYKVEIVKLVRNKFLIPNDSEIDRMILSHVNLMWKSYKATLKRTYFDSNKTQHQIASNVPLDVVREQWVRLVTYWFSAKGKKLSAIGKRSRAQKTHCHTTGSKSFAQKKHEFAIKEKREPTLLEAWKITHLRSDGSYVKDTKTKEFMECAEGMVNDRIMNNPDMHKESIENAVFQELMYDQESSNQRLVGYGHGVSRSQVFGLKADLRKFAIENDSMEVEVKQKLISLEKENKQLKEGYTNLQSHVRRMTEALARNGIVFGDPIISDEEETNIDDHEVREMESSHQNLAGAMDKQNHGNQTVNIKNGHSGNERENNNRYLQEILQPHCLSPAAYCRGKDVHYSTTSHAETQPTVATNASINGVQVRNSRSSRLVCKRS